MNRYKEALGIIDFTVDGLEFSIVPQQGDNKKFLQIQKLAKDAPEKFMGKFVDFAVELIAREESIESSDKTYEDLSTFVEMNMQAFLEEFVVGFKWQTREAYRKNQEASAEGFLNQE